MTDEEIVEIGAQRLYGDKRNEITWSRAEEALKDVFRHAIRELIAALREAGLVVEQGWRFDMENAPRDGTWFTAMTKYEFDGADAGLEPCCARWVGGEYPWQIGGTGENALKDYALICWRHLPTPPDPQ